VFAYDPQVGQFLPLTERGPADLPPSARLTTAQSI
jgi:hypothetical protein